MWSLRISTLLRILVIVNIAVIVDSLSLEPIAPPTITLGQPFTVTWHRNVQADPTDWFLLLGTPFLDDFLGQIVFDVPNSEAPDGTLTGFIPTTGVETGSMQIVAGERSLPNGKPWATPVTSIQVVRTDAALTSQHRNTDTASPTSRPRAVSPPSTTLVTTDARADSTSDVSSRATSAPEADSTSDVSSRAASAPEVSSSISPSLSNNPETVTSGSSSSITSDASAETQPSPSDPSNSGHRSRLDFIFPSILCSLYLIAGVAGNLI